MRIFTDPHIGRRAAAHTTTKSSIALDTAIFKNAVLAADSESTTICVGDLFDKSHNREVDILRGIEVGNKCDIVLAGNHDLANRDNVSTSIEIIGQFTELVRMRVNESGFKNYEDDDEVTFTIIPHHSSQDLFDQALERCLKDSSERDIVFLHCNYNNPFAQNDASLNLTEEQAKQLLLKYKFIVLGHEHTYRTELGGRLIILGNTHPTSFGDISDKYLWEYSKEEGFSKEKIWDKATKFENIHVTKLLESGFQYTGQNFIEVSGEEIDAELAPAISQALQGIWDSATDELYMVRNNVTFKSLAAQVVDKKVQLEDVTDAISSELEGSDLKELWEAHLTEAENA